MACFAESFSNRKRIMTHMNERANKQMTFMDLQKSEVMQDAAEYSEDRSWRPEVLAGKQAATESKNDFEISEVWHWYHARLKLLGKFSDDQARLYALLNWREPFLKRAIHSARLEVNLIPGDDRARQAHLEYLAAEYLARQVLDIADIPRIEPQAA
jgi:hypothetical protein